MDQKLQPNNQEQGPISEQAEQPVAPVEAQEINTPELPQGPENTPELQGEQVSIAPVGPEESQPLADNQGGEPASEVASGATDITEPTPATDLDKTFVKAANEVIDKYEGKPFEEEEEHHKLQIKYLWQKFKRKIGKD